MRRSVYFAAIMSCCASLRAGDSASDPFAQSKAKGAYFYASCGPGHFGLLAKNGFNCGIVKLGLSLAKPGEDSKGLASIGNLGRSARQHGIHFFPCLNYAGHPEVALLGEVGRRFVTAEGRALPKTPCPSSRDYWERVIGSRLAVLAERAEELGIGGVLFDPEMYGADIGGYTSVPCLCHECFRAFADARRQAVPKLDAAERTAWLKGNELDGAYRAHAEDRMAEVASSVREQIRARNPDIHIGFLNYWEGWYYNGLIRGLGTAARPVSVWTEQTYSTGYGPRVKSMVESFAKRGMHARLIGGLWLQKFMPKELPGQCYHMAQDAGGYWVFTTYSLSESPEKLQGDYAVPAQQSTYWSALREANREIDKLAADPTYETALKLLEPAPIPTTLAIRDVPTRKLVRLFPEAKLSPIAARPTQLRARHFMFTNAEAGEPVQIELACQRLGSYRDAVALLVFGPDGKQVAEGAVGFGKTTVVEVRAPTTGTYTLVANASANKFSVRVKDRPQAYWAEKRIDVCGYAAPLYFLVPSGVEQFEINVVTGAELETVKARVIDPVGNVVASKEGGFPNGTRLSADVPAEHAGKLWKLTLTRAAGPGVFEDVTVSLSDNLPPYLSESPEGMLLPER